MQRRRFLASAAFGAMTSAVAAPAIAESAPELRWRLATGFPAALDIIQATAASFARNVAEATDGRFRIELQSQPEGFDPTRTVDDIGAGRIDAVLTASSYAVDKDPTFALLTAAPFGLNARQQNAWLYEVGGLDLANTFYAKHGLYALPGGNTGAQMGGWFRREVKTVADLAGLRMRLDGLGAAVMQKLGALPQRIPAGDIAAAFERGALDAAEWVGPYDDEKLGLARAAPFYYYPGWWEGGAALSFLFNKEKWAGLPKAYRAAVTTAAAHANLTMTAKYDARNPGALRRLAGTGTQFRLFSQDIMEAGYRASTELFEEISAKNPDFRTIWDSIRAFRGEEYLWFQFAEYPFDNFMIRARAKGG
ncbi:MAG TPA: ABC transporter substrate-binding protein [Enterovirga sp.]|nr:ABC transporter substrate-binding protein [Enterovirga sp.]